MGQHQQNTTTITAQKLFVVNQISQLLLQYLYVHNVRVPFDAWSKNRDAICYADRNTYNLAEQIAIKEYLTEVKSIAKQITVRTKN